MTSKEKAEELIEKHKMRCIECGGNETAKIHSLIAVDEVLSLLFLSQAEINYWQKVKNEIEKL